MMRKLKSSLPLVVYVLWVWFFDLDSFFAAALLLVLGFYFWVVVCRMSGFENSEAVV